MARVCLCAFLVLLALGGCVNSPPEGFNHIRQAAIYDKDDRMYTDDHPDATLKKLAEAVAMSVSYSRVNVDDTTKEVTLDGDNLTTKIEKSSNYNQKPLCADEPFRLDPAPGSCTVFLVGPDRVATAGHCIDDIEGLTGQQAQYWCNRRAFVFRFKKGRKLTEDDVYRCRRVLVHGYSSTPKLDYGMFQLRRVVKGIQPLALDPKPNLPKGHPIAIIGFPHGTWQKIAAGGIVYDPRTDDFDYFKTTLDTMPGNSGSPVFSTQSYKVVGIHVRGGRPVYDVDPQNDCNKSHVYTDGKGRQSANYLNLLEGTECKADADCPASHACEQGRCYYRTVDLQYVDAKISANSGKIGDEVKIDVTIKNVGNIDATSDFRVGIWWSTNDNICVTCGQDMELGSQVIQGGLAVGATVTRSFTVKIDGPFKEGDQFIGVEIDDIKLATKAYSFYGDIAELSEDNNEKTFAFAVKPACSSDCTSEGQRRCQGASVEICSKGTGDQASCLLWTKSTDCQSGMTCKEGACVPIPRKNGESCKTNADCASGHCIETKSEKICSASCVRHDECLELGRPFCGDGVCRPIPDGKCVSTGDCGAGFVCLEDGCKPLPKPEPTAETTPDAGPVDQAAVPDAGPSLDNGPPSGCSGCSARPGQGRASWFFALCLLLGCLALRKRKTPENQ